MSAAAKVCPCGREITKDQWAVETPAQHAERLESGRCRAKCKRLFPAGKAERGKPSLPDSIPISSLVGEGIVLRPQPKEQPWRSESYRDFIRTQICLNPDCRSGMQSEAHHEQEVGHGGKATLCDDSRTLPLCPLCHVPIRHHYGRSIWRKWKIDPEQMILHFNELWMRQGGVIKS